MIELAAPWLLLLLPLPWLLRWCIPSAKIKQQAALRVPFYQSITQLSTSQHFTKLKASTTRSCLAYLLWCLLVLAAAGPQWLGEPIELPRNGRDIMMAVDLSGSMRIPDMQVAGKKANRLQAIKSVADNFIQQRKGDRLGLILFGSRAYLQTPLTFDRQTVAHMLNDSTIGLAGQQTAIGDAIGLAVKRLMKYPKQSRVLILLTDGANNSGTVAPLAAAHLAAQQGIKIYTIGFGADSMVLPSVFGPQRINPSADLDESTLEDIAKATGGQFFRAKNTQALAKVYKTLDKLEPISSDKTLLKPIKPLYPWPLALALLISCYLAWRHCAWLQWRSLYKNASTEVQP